MRYNISIMTAHGSYEFIVEGDPALPQKLQDAFAKGDAITFTDVEGAEIIMTPLNIIGIITKAVAEDEAAEEGIIISPPPGMRKDCTRFRTEAGSLL